MARTGGKVLKRVLVAVAIAIVALFVAFVWYVNDYNHADEVALAVVADEDASADGVIVEQLESGDIAFVPEKPTVGLVFYPGAKVQPESYAPLLRDCAQKGILCVLVKPMFNLALLDVGAADRAQSHYPEIATWVVAGHSMGGVAASNYAAGHLDDVAGVVYLAAYPDADLSKYGGAALSILATNDGCLRKDAYYAAKGKMPALTETVEIAGGNHAQFGNYGKQAGDGAATISREDQQAQTADAIVDFVRSRQS